MIKSVSLFLMLGFVAAVSLPLRAKADLITGVLNFTGTAQISLGEIAFIANSFSVNAPASSQQGEFAALEGTTGTIENLTNPPDATGTLNIPDYITFTAAPNISITLTYLLPGIDGSAGCSLSPAATGQECTPVLPNQSPFNLQNTSATSSSASFNVLGVEVDTITGDTTPITGAFTTPFTNQSFQDLLATIAGDRTVTTPFSAQFSTESPVPEPDTFIYLVVVGAGILGIPLVRRLTHPQSARTIRLPR